MSISSYLPSFRGCRMNRRSSPEDSRDSTSLWDNIRRQVAYLETMPIPAGWRLAKVLGDANEILVPHEEWCMLPVAPTMEAGQELVGGRSEPGEETLLPGSLLGTKEMKRMLLQHHLGREGHHAITGHWSS